MHFLRKAVRFLNTLGVNLDQLQSLFIRYNRIRQSFCFRFILCHPFRKDKFHGKKWKSISGNFLAIYV